MSLVNLLETRTQGWCYPYRSKKAHYFTDKQSICGKHTISEYGQAGLLPLNAFFYQNELCKKCFRLQNSEV